MTKSTETQKKAEQKTVAEAGWVHDMRAHYSKTGAYRAGDLARLLGNPGEYAQARTISTPKIGSKLLNE